MSEEIKETLTEKEAMEVIEAFSNMCYNNGVRDALIGICVGGGVTIAVSVLVMFGVKAIDIWEDRKKLKN